MEEFTLKRTKQCGKCPWKVNANPNEIPNGYCEIKHENLKQTIAEPNSYKDVNNKVLKAMACHDSPVGKEDYCIGWVNNQLGVGNNIMLRMKMIFCTNRKDVKVFGKQHQKFEDTLPK